MLVYFISKHALHFVLYTQSETENIYFGKIYKIEKSEFKTM